MAHDLVRITANERVDLVDFEHLADSGFQANIRQPNAQFMTDPNAQRSWILDGFAMTNPAGKQLQVTKGRAILGQREGALIHYGALTVEGDATKTIDMATLTPTTYGVYVRFEYVDGDTGSRIFWNPAGTGEELAQTVATRRNANWSIRVELTNPGGEWLKIGEANNVGGSLVITDQRPMYFEGTVHSTYQSGWSSEGGGVADDRNADRQQYGVKDFQTFTQATRQCLEDLKGRGLRRWWDKGIGGMNVGFDDDPTEDRVAVGSSATFLEGGSVTPRLELGSTTYFDRTSGAERLQVDTDTFLDASTNDQELRVETDLRLYMIGTDDCALAFDYANGDRIYFDRTGNFLDLALNYQAELRVEPDGVRVARGLYIGSILQDDIYQDDIMCEGGINCGGTTEVDQGEGIFTDGIMVGEDLAPYADDVNIAGGLHVGFTGSNPAADEVKVGDTNFGLDWVSSTQTLLRFDSNAAITYYRDTDIMYLTVDGLSQFVVTPDGCRVREGLRIGDDTGSIYDDDAVILGGLAVGVDTNPDPDRIILGTTSFYLDWNGTDPIINFDSNDFLQYDRSAQKLILNIGSSRPMFGWDAIGTGDINPEFTLQAYGTKARTDPIDNLYSWIRAPQDQPSFGDAPTAVKIQPTAQLVFDVGDTTDANGFSTYRIFRFMGGQGLATNPVRTVLAGGWSWEIPFGAAGSENAPYIEYYDAQPQAGPISTGNQLELNANPISSGAVQCYGQLTFESNRSRKLEPKFYSSGIYDFGDSTAWFDECYMDTYYGKNTTVQSFDCYNDLALVDAYQPVPKMSMIEKGGERRMVQEGDVDTLPWPMLGPICPKDKKPFMNLNDSIFFLLGALKQLHAKHKSEVGLLRAELAELKGVPSEALLPQALPAVSSKLELAESLRAVVETAGEDQPLTYMNTVDWEPADTRVTEQKPVILVGSTGKHCRLSEKEARDGLWRGIIIHPSILKRFPIEDSFMGDYIHPVRAYVKQLILAGIPIWSGRSVRRK